MSGSGVRALAVAPQPVAVEAAIQALRRGGNVVDAAVTAAFVQMIVDPQMCGIGGFGVAHLYAAASGETTILDFPSPAGALARPEMWADRVVEQNWDGDGFLLEAWVNDIGYGSVGVPGTVAGMAETLRLGGTINWAEALQPAIELAEQGFLVPLELFRVWFPPPRPGRPPPILRLSANQAARDLYLKPDGEPYRPGEHFRNPDYARTLERLARDGWQAFYQGDLADEVVHDLSANGAFVTAADLAAYRVRHVEPLRTTYRGRLVTSTPAPSGGPTVLEMLNILEGYDVKALELNSEEYVWTVARAMQAAVQDRVAWIGDPELESVPMDRLLSPQHAADWRRHIDAGEPIRIPVYEREAAGTTHISVVDAAGNVAAITHSLGWTSGLVCPGLGFMYNNALSRFDPLPGTPNSIGPGRARRTGMCPTVVSRDGEPVLVVGAPGGTRIFTAVLQTLLNVIDHGLSPTEAVSAPRFDCQTEYLDAESRIPSWIKAGLARRGFRIFPNPSALNSLAYVQAIARDPASRALTGGSDPRGGGCVLGMA